jgi:DNA-binding beta-propeller fold protein YncE
MKRVTFLLALFGAGMAGAALSAPLELESKILLGNVSGRIDHLAIDGARQRLYVAELGNDSVGVVDLREHKLFRTLTGLKEPQGIGYVSSTDTLYVANAGDGSVRLFQGPDLIPVGEISLGRDADNIRVEEGAHRLYVGYGEGALAVIDTDSRRKIAEIALKDHPESFRIDPSSRHIFVNVPDAHEIAVIDRGANRQIGTWPMSDLRSNYPLIWDEATQRVIAVFRHPAKLGVFRALDGQLLTSVATCGDADDAFLDAKRSRIYVICGEGVIDVLAAAGLGYSRSAQIPTSTGSRTGLYDASIDRLMLAVRSSGRTHAAVWVFRAGN